MRRYKVIVTQPAKEDMVRCIEYLGKHYGEMVAKKYSELFKQTLTKLRFIANDPEVIKISGITGLPIRKIHIKRYLLFYDVNNDNRTVRVLRIGHSLMDWKKLFEP